MFAVKLYDIETGHVETLTQLPNPDTARRWLDTFRAGGVGTNDVVYLTEVPPPRVASTAGTAAEGC